MLRNFCLVAFLLFDAVRSGNFGIHIDGPCTDVNGCEYNYKGMTQYTSGIFVAPSGWDGKLKCPFNEWYHVEAKQSWEPGKKWIKYCKGSSGTYFECKEGTCLCHVKLNDKGKEIEKEECRAGEWCLKPTTERPSCYASFNSKLQCNDERGCACQTQGFGNELLICAKSQFCDPGLSSPDCSRANDKYWSNREFQCKLPSAEELAVAKAKKDQTEYQSLLRKTEQIKERGCRCSTQHNTSNSYCAIGKWCKLRGNHNHCNDKPKYHDPKTFKIYEDNMTENKKNRILRVEQILI